ncbi:MAG: protein-disulfide reductase DsbD [Alphaproteobacteria bacterium]|nr:protein-disulfide reductase DsbD [Alphaproteobacteria bacterium]
MIKLFFYLRGALLATLALTVVWAGAAAAQPMPPEEAFQLEVRRSGAGDIIFDWTIADGHYLYRKHTVATLEGGETALPLARAEGEAKTDPAFGDVEVWHGRGEARLSAADLESAGGPAVVNITYQGCLEDSICYPPMTETVALPKAVVTAPGDTALAAREADVETAVAASALALQASAPAPADPATFSASDGKSSAQASAGSSSNGIALQSGGGMVERLALRGGVLWVLLAFFGFGVLLAFTPCVFPMYPILAGVIGRGVDAPGGRRGFELSVAYVLGLAVAFALLGVAAAWSGQNLQMALQSPWAVGALSLIFVALALSMFGLYELQLPSSWSSRLSGPDKERGRRSLGSAAGMGFVSALIVGPCVTAPLAGALLYIAQTRDLLLGAAALFALGLGKGAPLIAFGALGSKVLPRAGAWMDRVKAAFGVLFLVTAWWLSSRILPAEASLLLGAGLMLLVAVLLGLFRPATGGGLWSGAARAGGLAAAVWGVLLLVGAASGADDPWRPLTGLFGSTAQAGSVATNAAAATVVSDTAALTQAVAAAGAAQSPSLVYFTADWCVSCKVIDRTVFADPEVQAALTGARLIEVDVTRTTPETRALLKDFAVVGPPTMIFLDATATEPDGSRLVGEMGARDVIDSLGRAGAPG